jgi:predicted negative regulator of RcsB-dependent stress response
MSAIDLERKNPAKAQTWLAGQKAPAGFQALYDDRLGDIAMLQDKKDEAKTYFLSAWKGMEEKNESRRLIEVKLAALGVNPQPVSNP